MLTNRRFAVIVIAILAIVAVAISITGFKFITRTKQEPVSQQATEITVLTKELISSSRKYRSKVPFVKKPEIQSVITIAEERKEKMIDLAKDDPQAFLDNSLSEKEQEQMPEEVKEQGLVEQDVSKEGSIAIVQMDNFTEGTSSLDYSLKEGGDEKNYFNLHFVGIPPQDISTGDQVTVEGIALEKEMVVPDTEEQSIQVVSSAEELIQDAPKEEQIAVIMFNFLNDKTQPMTADELRQGFFTDPKSANVYFQENSYGKIKLTGNVFGPYTVPYNREEGRCDGYNDWAIAADSMAFANGIDITQYPKRAYVFPRPENCWAGAWANIGGNPSRMWLPGGQSMYVISHEFGHNLGQRHATFLNCSQGAINQLNDCPSVEYGDPSDVMGHAYFQYNAPHKIEANWLADNHIVEATSSGTYTITPLEIYDASPKVIKILISNDYREYYVGYRQPIGFDSQLGNMITSGVQIHAWDGNAGWGLRTNLLDANYTPTTNSNAYTSSLNDGATYVDAENGIEIKQISHDADSATVEIIIDKTMCQRNTPQIEVNPISQNVGLGETTTYNLNIKNMDDTDCTPSTFFLHFTPYDRWDDQEIELVPSQIELNPGESSTAQISLTPRKGALGTKHIKIGTSGYFGPHSASTEIEYTLEGTIERVAIQPTSIITNEEGDPIHLSALAYDTYDRAIWTGVTYEWGISSNNSIGSVIPDVNVATFTPLKPGIGDLYVTGKYKDGNIVSGSIRVEVEQIDKRICSTDSDCGCALDIKTNVCAIENIQYLTGRCFAPDFCAGFSGNCLPKCIEGMCKLSCPSPIPTSTPDITSSPIPTSTPAPLINEADINGDGLVDTEDLNIAIRDFGKAGSPADLNKNGIVDIFDFNAVIRNFGNKT